MRRDKRGEPGGVSPVRRHVDRLTTLRREAGTEWRNFRQPKYQFLLEHCEKVGTRATFEEIGWTPIRLRRWLRVKRIT